MKRFAVPLLLLVCSAVPNAFADDLEWACDWNQIESELQSGLEPSSPVAPDALGSAIADLAMACEGAPDGVWNGIWLTLHERALDDTDLPSGLASSKARSHARKARNRALLTLTFAVRTLGSRQPKQTGRRGEFLLSEGSAASAANSRRIAPIWTLEDAWHRTRERLVKRLEARGAAVLDPAERRVIMDECEALAPFDREHESLWHYLTYLLK